MNEMIDMKSLPYGSVVSLKNSTELLLIIGVYVVVKDKDDAETIYDYSAVRLPKGYQGDEDVILFNGENIDKVVHHGYFDEKIKSYYEDIKWLESRRKKDE